MNEAGHESENEVSFIEPIKAGHIFFYDSKTDEVVHLRNDIFEAAQENSEGMNLELTDEEKLDAEDAWEILADRQGRYFEMPSPPPELLIEWDKEFAASGQENHEAFLAAQTNQFLLEWLESVKVNVPEKVEEPASDTGRRRSRRPN